VSPVSTCPLCGREVASDREYQVHLEDAHGLTDDPGTRTVRLVSPTETGEPDITTEGADPSTGSVDIEAEALPRASAPLPSTDGTGSVEDNTRAASAQPAWRPNGQQVWAAGILLGFFLPWFQFVNFSISGYHVAQVITGDRQGLSSTIVSILMWLVPIAAVGVMVASLRKNRMLRSMAAIAAGLPLAGFVYSVARDTGLFETLAVGAYITVVSAGLLMLDTLGLLTLPRELGGGWQKRDRLVGIGAVVLVAAGVVLGMHEQNRAYRPTGSAFNQATVAQIESATLVTTPPTTQRPTVVSVVPTVPLSTPPPCPSSRPKATVTMVVATSDPAYPTLWTVELTVRVANRTTAPVKYSGFTVDNFDASGNKLDTKHVSASGVLAPHGKESFDDPEVVMSDAQPVSAVVTDMTYSWDSPDSTSCPQ
jgi:hypothetical protein